MQTHMYTYISVSPSDIQEISIKTMLDDLRKRVLNESCLVSREAQDIMII